MSPDSANEPIKFGVRNCPFCGEETPDWRIDCTSCGQIFPPFDDLMKKTKLDIDGEIASDEKKPGNPDT